MKEAVILNVLNNDKGIFAKFSADDRRCMAGTIARILDAVEKSEFELKSKVASAEILAKLELIQEVGVLHDELKKIPYYKFSARREMKLEILELESKLMYGGHFGASEKVPIENV